MSFGVSVPSRANIISLLGILKVHLVRNERSRPTLTPLIWSLFSLPTDYESPSINETDYNQLHPYVRSGYGYQTHDRARHRLNTYANVITQIDREQFDYVDDRNRKAEANFYDNKYYDNFKMHRWVGLSFKLNRGTRSSLIECEKF